MALYQQDNTETMFPCWTGQYFPVLSKALRTTMENIGRIQQGNTGIIPRLQDNTE